MNKKELKVDNIGEKIIKRYSLLKESINCAAKEEKGLKNKFNRIVDEYEIRLSKYEKRQLDIELFNMPKESKEEIYNEYLKELEWSKKYETIQNIRIDVEIAISYIKERDPNFLKEMGYSELLGDIDFDYIENENIKKYYYDIVLPLNHNMI